MDHLCRCSQPARTQLGQRGAGCGRARALCWASALEHTPEQTCRCADQGSILEPPAVSSRAAGELSRADVELVQPLAPRMLAERLRSGLEPQLSITTARIKAAVDPHRRLPCPSRDRIQAQALLSWKAFPGVWDSFQSHKAPLATLIPEYPTFPQDHSSATLTNTSSWQAI